MITLKQLAIACGTWAIGVERRDCGLTMQFAPLYPWLHQVLSPLFPACLWHGNPQQRAIALTFDDGPHPEFTLPLLASLDRWGIRASFFCLGLCVDRQPAIARAIWEQGHWLGLHGYTHRSFPQLSPPALQASLIKTQRAIATATQQPWSEIQQRVRDVRPPNGFFLPSTLTHLRHWGYRPVMWSVVPEDWAAPGLDRICHRVLQQTQNGAIIVLHDGCYGGQTVTAAVDQIVPILLAQGYEFVTVDQLWSATHPADRTPLAVARDRHPPVV